MNLHESQFPWKCSRNLHCINDTIRVEKDYSPLSFFDTPLTLECYVNQVSKTKENSAIAEPLGEVRAVVELIL